MTQHVRRMTVCLAALCLTGGAVSAQWRSVGALRPSGREAGSASFQGQGAIVSVAAISDDVIRIRFSPTESFGRDHSYAVAAQTAPAAHATIASSSSGAGRTVLKTSSLTVTIGHDPFRIAIADAAGEILDEDDAAQGMAASGSIVRAFKRLLPDEHVYGLGEKTGRLDKRGRQLGGYSYTMWNSDTFAYGLDTDPLYVSVPFALVVRNGKAHGLFLDNTYRATFDIGHASEGILAFGADGGELNYYFINGPAPADVITRFTALTGRMPMPPRWSLGYQQCRYSYYPESVVRELAANFRSRHIPADGIWLDIHYMDGYKPFTWDRERFPDPARLVKDLGADGFHLVTIVDPHPKKEVGYKPYDSGLAGDHFVKNPDGSVYEAPVWPSQAEHNPGPSVFPDFTRPATRTWWGRLYSSLLDIGVAGIWNDMNEPAVFDTPTGTMPLTVRFDNDGEPAAHRAVHNVYGMLMSRSTYEGLLQARPDARPFVLTRASYAGGQRYAAVWAGDNVSDWSQLRGSLPQLMGLGLSGFPFVGVDIGGFAEVPSADLYTRWLQAGVFYPFMRTHTVLGTPQQDPWSYGPDHERVNRRAIELRYELLPHLYSLMHDASVDGLPVLRPLMLEFPGDAATSGLDDQFMVGHTLLVAPVLWPDVRDRNVYLPAGDWFDFWTGAPVHGGRSLTVPVTLESIPLFVRAGSFLFEQPVVQHTGEMSGKALRVGVFPGADAAADFYEDDGETREYEHGGSLVRRFRQRQTAAGLELSVERIQGDFDPPARDLWLIVHRAASSVTVGGRDLPRLSPEALTTAASGWSLSDSSAVVIKLRDTLGSIAIAVKQ